MTWTMTLAPYASALLIGHAREMPDLCMIDGILWLDDRTSRGPQQVYRVTHGADLVVLHLNEDAVFLMTADEFSNAV